MFLKAAEIRNLLDPPGTSLQGVNSTGPNSSGSQTGCSQDQGGERRGYAARPNPRSKYARRVVV